MKEFNKLANHDRTNAVPPSSDDSPAQISRERKYIAWGLIIIALLTTGDIIEDRSDGASWSHVLSELVIVVVATGSAVFLFDRSRAPLIRKSQRLQLELIKARADAQKWKAETGQLLEGLSAAISRQLDQWKLSEAEKEIALLLLKGLSHKEIAIIRETTEPTVRQQAASLYRKSGLAGRTELSSFFLEDLLVQPQLKD